MAAEFTVKVDLSGLKRLIDNSPKQADKAMGEALRMAGGHYRKWLRRWIETSGEGTWPPLVPFPGQEGRKPLAKLGRLVRFKVSRSKARGHLLRIGFLWVRGGKQSVAAFRKQKGRWKAQYGTSLQALIRAHEHGKSIRVTKGMRRTLAGRGKPIRGATKTFTIPRRPMVSALWERQGKTMAGYVRRRFMEKFLPNVRKAYR